MTSKRPEKESAEAFVRRVLEKTFKQRVNKETVREIAAKVSEAVAAKDVKRSHSKQAA